MKIHWGLRRTQADWYLPGDDDSEDPPAHPDNKDCSAAGTMRYMVRWLVHHNLATEAEAGRKGTP